MRRAYGPQTDARQENWAFGRPPIMHRLVRRSNETDDTPYPRTLERRARPRPPLHFKRIELKYFIPDRLIPYVLERLAGYTVVDPYLVKEGRGRTSYPVTSLYFDSYDLQALDEKADGLLLRRKIRLRTYEMEFSPETPAFMEIKRRLDAVVLKDRLALGAAIDDREPPSRLLPHLLDICEDKKSKTYQEARMMAHWLNLQPTALVRYRRVAYVGRDNPKTRVTIDVDLQAAWKPPYVCGDIPMRSIGSVVAQGTDAISGRYGMLELKCDNMVPAWFHEALQDLELRRTAFSKYYLAVSTLRPHVSDDCFPHFTKGGKP